MFKGLFCCCFKKFFMRFGDAKAQKTLLVTFM